MVHAPDFIDEVDVTVQMSREGAADAVQRGGPSLLAALSDFSTTLSAEDMHTLRTADRDGREEIMKIIMKGRRG